MSRDMTNSDIFPLTITMAHKLRICSYNVCGFNTVKSVYINKLLETHDILLLQEHWLYDSQSHLLHDHIPGVSYYSVSGMTESRVVSGRRYGGCAVLWKTSLSCTVEPVNIDNKRICAIKLMCNGKSILLCSIYMPCDTTYDDDNMQSYISVFNDILHNHVCNKVDHIIIGGDLNTDLKRTTSLHTKHLLNVCDKESLKCAASHSNFNIDYTYESTINHIKSVIDHFIVSRDIYDSIEQFVVQHDGDNLSDHDVISMQVPISVSFDSIDVEQVRKPLWRKATDQHICQYKYRLDAALDNMCLPTEALHCNDRFCSAHQGVIQSYHDNIISACMEACSCIPHSKPGNHKAIIPSWSDHVKEYKDKAIFWHGLWKDNGSPNKGVIFDIRRKTRWEYHRILKIIKRNKEALSAERMARGLPGNGFWSEVKQVIGTNKTLPNNIDGVQGSDDIADLFNDKYKDLYNSVGYNARQMIELREEIDSNISRSTERYDSPAKSTALFTANDICDSITSIKYGKGGGQDGHSSDNIRYGTRKLYVHLAFLYNFSDCSWFCPNGF